MSFLLHRLVGRRTVLDEVPGARLVIGRGTGAQLRIEDTAVDLEHAEIRKFRQDDRVGWLLRDLGSVTGTYVDGQPVESKRLGDGDEIGIGEVRIKVRWKSEEDPLFLHVRPVEADPRPGAAPVVAEDIDWAKSFRLRRGLVNKGFFALVATAAALVFALAIPLFGRFGFVQPGDLSPAHAGLESTVLGASSCASCHVPWAGVRDARCNDCHGPGAAVPAPAHHDAVLGAAARACASCHVEHLGTEALMRVSDADCAACHRDLPLADGVEPLYEPSIADFADDHPQFRIAVPASLAAAEASRVRGLDVVRLPVDAPAIQGANGTPGADRTALALDHALHLQAGLTSPEGRVQLVCTDCHRPAVAAGTGADGDAPATAAPPGPGADGAGAAVGPVGPTGLVRVEFEAHCERCHALTYDAVFADADTRAPHAEPRQVRAELYRAYQEDPRRPGRQGRLLTPAEERVVLEAERRLYAVNCTDCHTVALADEPGGLPAVAPPNLPTRWLPHGRFPHERHPESMVACVDCHTRAPESRETSDVLIPGIETCTPCHGGGAREGFPRQPVATGCMDCHGYHSGAGPEAGPFAPSTPSVAALPTPDPASGGALR